MKSVRRFETCVIQQSINKNNLNVDLEWLNPIIDNCIIYNKGNKLGLSNEIILDNVGREAETYLHYIIDNYDNLPDIVKGLNKGWKSADFYHLLENHPFRKDVILTGFLPKNSRLSKYHALILIKGR